jgi:hypothetical protein
MSDPERSTRWRACFPTFLRGRDWLAQSPPVRLVRRSWRRAFKWALVGLLVLGVVHAILSVHASSRLAARLDALVAAGKLVYGRGPEPPGVPDGENAGPLYAAAAAWVRLHDRPDGWDPSVPPGSESRLHVGYRDLLTRDGKFRDLSTEEFRSLSRAVALDRPALGLIREGAARPHCRFERDWSRPLQADLGRSDPRQLQRFLAANVLVAARTGQDALALECLRLGFVVARHEADEPTVTAGLFAARGAARTMMTTAAQLLPGLRLADADAKALADELIRVNLGATLLPRWDHERRVGLYRYGALRGPEVMQYVSVREGGPVQRCLEPLFWRHYGGGLLRPWFELDEVEYLEQMDRGEPILQASARERAEAWRATPDQTREPLGPWWAPATRQVAWGPVEWARAMDCWDVSCDLLRIVLGVECYRQHHGSYPAALQQLQAAGWNVPKDRFNEEDFVYKRWATSFVLYSVGPNLRDDGGEPGFWPFFQWRRYTTKGEPKGDIVWEYWTN